MKKLPVLATIRDAYRFTFTHLGAIIGLIWLPMILVTVIGFFVWKRYLDAMADALASNNLAGAGPESLGVICYFLAALLLFTMMSVPVTQLALGTRKQGALIYFAFGATEWRLFRGLMGLVGFLMLLLLLLVVAATAMASSGRGPAGAQEGMIILGLFFLAATAFFWLRFGVLLPALAASETEPLLPRAWKLTAGNFWRMLAVAAATLGPVWILSSVAQAILAGPQTMMPNLQSSTALVATEVHNMAMDMPVIWGIKFLVAPLMLGLMLGAGAAIYRALNGEKLP